MVLASLFSALQRFGLMCVVEPAWYVYDDGSSKRPDLTVFKGDTAIVTDLVISCDPENALKEKIEKHSEAVRDKNHVFVPIAMDIWGNVHDSVFTFLRKCFDGLPKELARLATLQTVRGLTEAWLSGSAAMLNGLSKARSASDVDVEDFGTRAFNPTLLSTAQRLSQARFALS